jgi:AraC-like DNA-binding protein
MLKSHANDDGAAVQRLRFGGGSAAEGGGFEAYHDLYAPVADVARLDGFGIEVSARRLDDVLMFDRRLRGVRHIRGAKRAARNGFDHFTAQIAAGGDMLVATGDGERRLARGEIALIDMRRPMATETRDARIVTLSIPRRRMEDAAHDVDRLHGAVLPRERAALLVDFVGSVLRRSAAPSRADGPRIARVMVELLAVGLQGQARDGASREAAADALCRERARRFIDENPAADPDAVAQALGRSRSALYRAFQPVGGVAAYIRGRRIARLRSLLADPTETRRIGELAYLCGFAGDSQCARAFRDEHGVSPAEFRAACRDCETAPRRETGFEAWWRDLR